MECFEDEYGNQRCYSERQVQETTASGLLYLCAALFSLWVAAIAIQIGTKEEWAILTPQPIGLGEVMRFAQTAIYDVAFAVVLFFGCMGMSILVFGAFRGPGSTPGPVMRDMSRGDFEPPWGDAPPRR